MRPVFTRLHALTLTPGTTVLDLTRALLDADSFPDRRRLSEGAVYTAACRRYLLDVGRDWRTETVTAATSTWATSAHRPRLTDTGWRCSCGESGTATHPAAAHAAHRSGALTTS